MNMDRFKYRYWNKDKKIMEPVSAFLTYENIKGESKIALYNHDCNAFNYNYDAQYLMQCTGITDIDGNMIWEGDVIQFGESRYQVTWNDELILGIGWFAATSWGGTPRIIDMEPTKIIGHRYDGIDYS